MSIKEIVDRIGEIDANIAEMKAERYRQAQDLRSRFRIKIGETVGVEGVLYNAWISRYETRTIPIAVVRPKLSRQFIVANEVVRDVTSVTVKERP